MPFAGHQVNTYDDKPQRLLLMTASLFGIPITVTHVYDEPNATMRGKLLSLITVVDGSGPDMDRAETVTLLNDLVRGAVTVSAELTSTTTSSSPTSSRTTGFGHRRTESRSRARAGTPLSPNTERSRAGR